MVVFLQNSESENFPIKLKDVPVFILLFFGFFIFIVIAIKCFNGSIYSKVIYADSNGVFTDKKSIQFSDIKYFKISAYQWASLDIYYLKKERMEHLFGTIGVFCSTQKIEKVRKIFITHGVEDKSCKPLQCVIVKLKKYFTYRDRDAHC